MSDPEVKTRDELLKEILSEIPNQVREFWDLRNDIERFLAGGKVEGYTVPMSEVETNIDTRIASLSTRKKKIDDLRNAAKTAPLV